MLGRKTLSVTSLSILLFGFAAALAFAQETAESKRAALQESGAEKYSLRWKFEPGEVIKVNQKFDTHYGVQKQSLLREYEYDWIVRGIDAVGRARIGIVFEDLKIIDSEYQHAFTATKDEESQDFNKRDQRNPLIYETRALFNSEVELLVSPDGGTEILSGAESLPNIRMFTPGDLIALPEHPVAVGESWKTRVGVDALVGEAICTLRSVENVTGRRIAKIESEVNWEPMSKQPVQGVRVKFEPAKVAARFDIDAGKYLEEENGTKMRLLAPQNSAKSTSDPPKTVETISIDVTRNMSDAIAAPNGRPMSGEYMLALDDNQFKSLVMAGVKVRKPSAPSLTTTEMLNVHFYHDWKDSDGDKSPMFWELIDVNRLFTNEEHVRCLITMFGMEKRRMRMDVVDASGAELHSRNIPIKAGPGTFAVRELKLPAGIYFFEFFVDNQFELRVPVRVVASK